MPIGLLSGCAPTEWMRKNAFAQRRLGVLCQAVKSKYPKWFLTEAV